MAGKRRRTHFSPDGRYLAGKRYSVILVWDVVADELFVSVEGAYRPGIAFRDATTLVYRDGVSIRLLNLRNGSTVAELPSEDGTDFTIFSHGSRLLDLRANTAALWDLEQPRLIAESQSIPSGYDIVAAADGSVAFATSFTSFGDFPNLVMMLSGANLSTPTALMDSLNPPMRSCSGTPYSTSVNETAA